MPLTLETKGRPHKTSTSRFWPVSVTTGMRSRLAVFTGFRNPQRFTLHRPGGINNIPPFVTTTTA